MARRSKSSRARSGVLGQLLDDQRDRARHFLQWVLRREIWVRPDVHCRRLRLGDGDGEWCICPDSLSEDSTVYSFGVGKDISFDLALIERFGVEVHAFDPTPISAEWLRRQHPPPQFHFHPFGVAAYDGTAQFSLPLHHGVSFTMLQDVPSNRTATGEVCRLTTIMEKLGHKRINLLKVDIEGAEYELIEQLVQIADRIDQLLIEFHHRLIKNKDALEQTRSALKQLAAGGFALFNVSPRGLEYSFIRR